MLILCARLAKKKKKLADQHGPGWPGRRDRPVRGLASGHLAEAGLDVLCNEPPEPGNLLLGLPKVVLSPNIAGTDTQSMSDIAVLAAQTVVELYHNRWLADGVDDQEIMQGWRW